MLRKVRASHIHKTYVWLFFNFKSTAHSFAAVPGDEISL